MRGRRKFTGWTAIGTLLMALTAAGPTGPAARAVDSPVDVDSLRARLLAALTQDGSATDEITPPAEEAAQPPTTQPAEEEPAPEEYLPPDIQVSAEGRVEMHVRDLDLGSVLQMLSMQAHRNIVASKKVSGRVTANLYNVTFSEALTAILDSNNATWRENGSFIYVYANDELAALDAARHPPQVRVFRLHYVRAADIKDMVEGLKSREGTVKVSPQSAIGISTSKEEAGGDSMTQEDVLVVTDYPDRLEQMARLIAELDVRPKQVLIEATILRALLNEDNSLGIDFNMVHGVDFRALAGTSTAGASLTLGSLPPKQIDNSTMAFNTDFRSQVPDGGLTFGFIHNDIAMFIRALEQVTDTTVLANPKILALNKQRGEVMVGRKDGYLTTTVTQTAAVQTVEFLETGTRLLFRPFIGGDGYVRMEVHPEDSTGGVTAANLPFEQTTEVTTNIMVRDGHTVLIGGLFRETTTSAREQLPVVGNIPIAGALFRNSHDTTQREEIIILLTVHVIKDDEALHEASVDVMEDVERYRVGMRQGLQWFGRERLAQAHYRWALEHLEKGHLSRALWDLDLAINNNPKFLAAVKLKEDLLCRREWDEENSALRGFLMRQIQREQGREAMPFGRPEPRLILPDLKGPSGFDEPPGDLPPDDAAEHTAYVPTTAPASGDIQ